ncbi:MAG: flagellar motor protein MotB [Bacteroidetes bacterium HGW-Bacteroidetes-17]|jgi:outer membrane protein OmpA-like peptidoglycan-associated protein|nr:MAG: flagellar motor protein MotB [Bacteroidetes bacterium HGW-Bacteroidetes-17]
MISKTNLKKESHKAWSPFSLAIKSLFLITLMFIGIQTIAQAQEVQFTKPSWWFGVAGGANFNFYDGTTQVLNSNLTTPSAFHKGDGIGLYLAPLMEFHRPDSRWGFMLQAGYDNRSGSFSQVLTPCNCPADLNTDLTYITIEPSLRLAPFKSNFYLYAGPRFAFNLNKGFTYKQGVNPDFPDQIVVPDVEGDFSNMDKSLISMQIGAGVDIPLSSQNSRTQAVLSPFVSFQPYFGQAPRSTESWNLTTLRAGITLKFGSGRKVETEVLEKIVVIEPMIVVADPEVTFTAYAPKNVPVEIRVRETFPLRNYVFFNSGSTEIPNRYVKLQKDQVKDFREDQLEVFTPKELSGRSKRQMTVYYNVLNILGDRMVKNPLSTITLVGSSMEGEKDGQAMAESVKKYLVDIFGIGSSRITTKNLVKPKLPSEQPGAKLELALLREEDRRVSIESNSPALLMEFQSGPDTPLKPVEIIEIQVAPFESYVSFNVMGADTAFSSWSLEISDEQGMVQKFGPYTKEKVSIPGKSILGTRPEGDYKVMMIGELKNGKTLKKEASVHLVLWIPAVTEEMMRFSIIYEFNNSDAIYLYDKYLTEIVTPKIPKNGTVIIHGHTDISGNEANNLKLSLARANDVKDIMEKTLAKAGRNDVKFEVSGFGENEVLAPFENKFPEERFYNRSVIIDILPAK